MKAKPALLLNAFHWIAYAYFLFASSVASGAENGSSWVSILPMLGVSIVVFYYFYLFLAPELLIKRDVSAFIKNALWISIGFALIVLVLQIILGRTNERIPRETLENLVGGAIVIQWVLALFLNAIQIMITGFIGTLIKTFLSVVSNDR